MRRCGIPVCIFNLIRQTCDSFMYQVVRDGKLTASTQVTSGGRQLPAIFLMRVDEVIRQTAEGKRRGINWNISEHLEDMAFVDDMCRLSETFVNMGKNLRDLQSEGRITRRQTVRN
jgi:hypothetical protein